MRRFAPSVCSRALGSRMRADFCLRARGRASTASLSILTLLSLAAPALAQEAVAAGTQPGGTVSTTEVSSAAPSEPADSDQAHKQRRRQQLMRRANTYYGAVGGIHVIEAGSGAPQSFRLQLATDFFFKNDYLFNHDRTRYVGGSLSLSVTPIEHLELSAAATTRSLRSKRPANALEPFGDTSEVFQTLGDPYFDVKSYGEVAHGVTLGADVSVQVLTKADTESVRYAGMSGSARANLSLDLREMRARVPLELRFNAGYVFDQSHKVVKDLERKRLSTLLASGVSQDTSGRDEFRQLALRSERYAYNVNRVDQATLAVGLEAPLELSKRVALHPIAEWELWIPVNRQNYNCSRALLPNGSKIPGQDSCLKDEGADVWQQRVTLGARLYPALPGFNLLAAVEIGVGAATNFVRELAPMAPYRVVVAASYAVDPKAKAPVVVVKQVEKRVEVAVAPKAGRIRGRVQEQGVGAPIANAKIVFSGRELSPLVTDAQGTFVSYEFAPGGVALEVDADGYRPGACGGNIAPEGGDTQVLCELVALPRVGSVSGRVLDADGAPVVGVAVTFTGADARILTTDTNGRFQQDNMPPGDYQARIEREGFLISITPVHVDVRKETQLQLQLLPKPKVSAVTIVKDKLKLKGTIFFNTDTAELQTRSEPLLTEVADTLLRNPSLKTVEIRGHTDNAGTPEHNRELSIKRAEAVKDWLVRAGVSQDRLTAQGYGSDKPIAANVSQAGRAKNRRVEFAITERTQP